MQHAIVLNVRPLANTDPVHVSAHDHIEPDRTIGAHFDVADDLAAAYRLLRTIERSGCYVVDDDLNLGLRWIDGEVMIGTQPLQALARAYCVQSVWSSTRFEGDQPRGPQLLKQIKARQADGVIFAAPSFCDPALLDQPPLQKTLTEANVPYIAFKYAENTGQFQGIREQAGTFSDSLKLWGSA